MSNPLLKDSVFRDAARNSGTGVMTISGTINKSIILWALFAVSFFYSWNNPQITSGLAYPAIFIGFILAMISIFNKPAVPFLSPIYAICQGIVLGFISMLLPCATVMSRGRRVTSAS